jgi:hypothetical protein
MEASRSIPLGVAVGVQNRNPGLLRTAEAAGATGAL